VGEDVGRLDSESDVGLDAIVRTNPLSGIDGVNAVVMRAPPVDVVIVRRDELARGGHVLLDEFEGTESSKSMEECGRCDYPVARESPVWCCRPC
jgi:hypothetical protein